MDSTKLRFFAPCPRGLEGVLEQEIHDLGVPMTAKTDGGIAFQAPWSTMYWVNLKSHIASRVLWEVGQAPYRSEDDVYRAAYGLPWPDWFTPSQTIKVKVSARRCPLTSLDFVTLRIKDAVCDKFMSVRHKRPSVDRHRPNIRLDAFLDESTATFYQDTSGEPLFKRGHRVVSVEAPLRENLAAGLLRLAGWTSSDVLALDAPAEQGVLLINPPYGVRLSRPEELDAFYPQLGDWLKQRFSGWRAYIFTGDLRVPKLIGLAPSKRTPLFNGPLECRLYEFQIVSGSMRKSTPTPTSKA